MSELIPVTSNIYLLSELCVGVGNTNAAKFGRPCRRLVQFSGIVNIIFSKQKVSGFGSNMTLYIYSLNSLFNTYMSIWTILTLDPLLQE